MGLEYIKRRQRQLEAKRQRAAELEAEKEAARVAKMKAIEREKERKKLLLEQKENERLRQKFIQKKKNLAEQNWNDHLGKLLTQVDHFAQENDKLEELRIIIRNRDPSLEELDWASWLLSDPLNQRLADLDFDHAVEMFKRDNLMAKRRQRTRGGAKKLNYGLSFTGDRSGATKTFVSTPFNPDTYSLWNGFTISFWVRPDEEMNQKSVILGTRASSPVARFHFGLSGAGANNIGVGIGGNDVTGINNPMEIGRWYNWVISYTGTQFDAGERKLRMWINTDARMTSNNSTAWNNQDEATESYTHGIYFGGRNTEGSGYTSGFACALDEVAIYNTCIDSDGTFASEVYNAGTGYNHKGNDYSDNLVGYWRLDEGGGTTARDSSGNGNHGTLTTDGTGLPTWIKPPTGYGQ